MLTSLGFGLYTVIIIMTLMISKMDMRRSSVNWSILAHYNDGNSKMYIPKLDLNTLANGF